MAKWRSLCPRLGQIGDVGEVLYEKKCPRGHSLAKPQRHSQEDPRSWPMPKSLQLRHASLQAPVTAEGTLVCGRVVQPPSDRQSRSPGAHGARAASSCSPAPSSVPECCHGEGWKSYSASLRATSLLAWLTASSTTGSQPAQGETGPKQALRGQRERSQPFFFFFLGDVEDWSREPAE